MKKKNKLVSIENETKNLEDILNKVKDGKPLNTTEREIIAKAAKIEPNERRGPKLKIATAIKLNVKAVQKACELGATDKDLAEMFNVNERTVNRWKTKHPEICQTIKTGKAIADEKVEHALFERATGYEHDDVHIMAINGQVVETPIVKRYPPDPTSMIFWLKNRKPKDWRDTVKTEITGTDGGPLAIELSKMTIEDLRNLVTTCEDAEKTE